MTADRRARLIKLAQKRGDKAAIAILEADRDYRPEPNYPMFVGNVWAGLRWSKAA